LEDLCFFGGGGAVLVAPPSSSEERSSITSLMISGLGRSFVRVSYCVSVLVIAMECGGGIVRMYPGVNEDVAIEYDA